MSGTLIPALAKSREGFDPNLVRRGHSNDSQETQDSPFGSSLATPLDPNDVSLGSTSASPNSALRFLVAASDTPLDYFRFKRNGSAIFSMARDLSSEGKLTPEDIASGYANAGTSRVCSAIGTPAEDTLMRNKSIYNLPNSPIDVQVQNSRRSASESPSMFGPMDDTPRTCISEDNGTHILLVEHSSATEDCTPGDDFAFTDEDLLWFLRPEYLYSLDITASITRVICFIPWCICVGGTMLLWPDKLEQVAFEAGYLDSTQGIRRFAHWADVGHQFVMIFLAFLATALWALPVTVGATLFVGLATRFGYVWRGFSINHSTPLGNDDRQSLYLLATVGRDLMEKSTLAKTEAGFVIVP